MTFFKKFSLTFASLVVLLSTGLGGARVFAVDVFQPCSTGDVTNSSVCQDAKSGAKSNPFFGPGGIGTTYIHILALVVGITSVAMIMFGGFRFVTSGGDPQATASARNTVIYAVIGLVVAISAQAIVSFVLSKLTVL